MMPGQALGELWAVGVMQYRLATPGIAGDSDSVRGQDIPLLGSRVIAQTSPDPLPNDPRLVKWDATPTMLHPPRRYGPAFL